MAKALDSSHGPMKWPCAIAGFVLLAIGSSMPFLCWQHWWPEKVLWVACGVVFVAFLAGMWGWPKFLAKITFWGSLVFATLAVVLTDRGLPTYPQRIYPTAEWMKPLDSTWETQSPGQPYSIQASSEVKRNGANSLRFDLRSGETWIDQRFNHTFRSEIATGDFPPANSVKWYAFSVYFPQEFPYERNRLLFGHWDSHMQLTQPARAPALAFRYIDGQLSVILRHSAEDKIAKPEAVPFATLFEKAKVRKGQWNDFVVQVKWSYQDDGFVNAWWNNEQIVKYDGPVGYKEATAPEFKFGLCRDATDKTYIAYFNGVKAGDSGHDVGFDPAKAKKYRAQN